MGNPNKQNPEKKNPIVRAIGFLFSSIIGGYAAITLIISAYFYLVPPQTAAAGFVLSGYYLILIATFFVALIIALLLRKLWIILLLLPNILIIGLFVYPYYAPKTPAVADGMTIRVMTYNIQNQTDEGIRNTYAELVESIGPGIVAFQEFPDFNYFRWQDSGQLSSYPYIAIGTVNGESIPGQGVYSQYPILSEEVWVYEDLSPSHPHQRLVLDINGSQVVLYNIHPFPPIEWDRGYAFAANAGDLFAHAETMNRLVERIQAETLPVIVVGDMNMSDQFPQYRQMSGILTDSFMEAGDGFGFTYPAARGIPQLIRLDYIFYSSQFQAVNAVVLADMNTSDHLPVVADLVLSN